jgi:hypothetical protein
MFLVGVCCVGCQMTFHSKTFEGSLVVEEKACDKLSQQLKYLTDQLVIQRNRQFIDNLIEDLEQQLANTLQRGR